LNGSVNSAPVDYSSRAAELESLHVLTLTPFFPSLENEVGGCFIKEPLDALAAMGVLSSVIAASPIYHRSQHPIPAAPAKRVRYPQIPGTIGLSGAGRFLYARLLAPVTELHRRCPIGVIHAHAALPCGHAAALLARRMKIPYLVAVHGLDVFNSCFRAGVSAEWRRRASARIYRDAAAVVCVSRRVQKILHDEMPDVRTVVVYNGTDPELFSPLSSSVQPISVSSLANDPGQELLVVGNLIPSKGQELVLRAIHRLGDTLPQLQCRIIGEGPDRARLEALAGALGIRERVQFLGRQQRAAVADAMRRCSVFVLPSCSEGLGCVYLEAMACAKPVIACREQGIEEIIEHRENGWLISPDNLDELSQALSIVLSSPELPSRLGHAARQTILNGLTLSHQAHNLATLYRQVAVLGAAERAL
jgi:teichuronic acid biosynthesis glycosyltransferase TuaC